MPQEPEIDAGALDRRVTLVRPVYNQTEDEITGWEQVADVWAAIDPTVGKEINAADRTIATVLVPIVIRYRPDIDARWRVVDRAHTYQIHSVVDVARRQVQLQLYCEEVL